MNKEEQITYGCEICDNCKIGKVCIDRINQDKNKNMEKKYKPIKPFNDHPNCKGHANFMLDSTLETEADRNMVIHAVENYIPKEELKAIKENEQI